MRVGIYLGRHFGKGGGIALYASSLVKNLLLLLASGAYESDEIVLYGESTVLSRELLEEIHLSPVLSAMSSSALDAGASFYFRVLPNGARVRLLVRRLPENCGRYLGYAVDQLLMSLYQYIDSLDMLHSVANMGILFGSKPQVVTIHDLFQGWPVTERPRRLDSASQPQKPSLGQRFYRWSFKHQLRKTAQVIAVSKPVAEEIVARFSFDPGLISVVPNGLDEVFVKFWESSQNNPQLLEQQCSEWLNKSQLRPGYVLVIASRDPRKNLSRTLGAWSGLPAQSKSHGLVILSVDFRARGEIAVFLRQETEKNNVRVLDWLAREDLPFLFYKASVVLLPTLSEGFGLPALEALSTGGLVVCSKQPSIGPFEDQVVLCDPFDELSIRQGLSVALRIWSERGETSSSRRSSAQAARSRKASEYRLPYRTMAMASRETYTVYRQVALRKSHTLS